jgi:hypothetical protein
MDYRKPSKQKANEDFLRTAFNSTESAYKEEKIEIKKAFLIICEGKNTEPLYFQSFPVPSNTVLIEGGCNTKTKLVDYALKIRNQEKYAGREVWCVFDFDIKPDEAATQPEDFNNAIMKAENNGMKVAWYNDAFELWFLLHYQSLENKLTRNEIYPILKEKWKLESFSGEAKRVAFSKDIYTLVGGTKSSNQRLAIERAENLHNAYTARKDYHKHCPCITVYLLVKELNKNIKE